MLVASICEKFAYFWCARHKQLPQMYLFAFDQITFSHLTQEGSMLTWVSPGFFQYHLISVWHWMFWVGIRLTGYLLRFTRYLCSFQLLWWIRIGWTWLFKVMILDLCSIERKNNLGRKKGVRNETLTLSQFDRLSYVAPERKNCYIPKNPLLEIISSRMEYYGLPSVPLK